MKRLLFCSGVIVFICCSTPPSAGSRVAFEENQAETREFERYPRLVVRAALQGDKDEPVKGGLGDFSETLMRIQSKQKAFSELWERADSEEEKAGIRNRARAFVVSTIINDILPAWLGTPWTMYAVKDGLKPDALMPNEKGKGTSCSYFVASVLTNAGLKLESRSTFARAIALHIQRSLAPDPGDLRRYHKITPGKLEKKLVELGEGLYLVGLNCHIGFIVVKEGEARFVHASYVEPFMVVDEPVGKSQAIENSMKSGYVVTALFRDDRLIELWLEGKDVPLVK